MTKISELTAAGTLLGTEQFPYRLDGANGRATATQIAGLAGSALFTQAGTGAVARTISSKIGETFSVTDFGITGTADDSTIFQNAINACSAAGGGTVLVPVGNFAVHNLSIPSAVILKGKGRGATVLQSWHTDNTVVTTAGTRGGIEDLSIFGKGSNNDTGTLGAVQNALVVGGVENVFKNLLILGGGFSIYITGSDNSFYDINASQSYSTANVATIAANWFIRCKFDQAPLSVTVTDVIPFATWAATTAYTVGKARITGGYVLGCVVAGTSGGIAPTVKNYGINITDGTVTWQLLTPSTYVDFLLGTGSTENHFIECDFSGSFTQSISIQSSTATTYLTDCILSAPIDLKTGNWSSITNCELGGDVLVEATYLGRTLIQGNFGVTGAINVTVAANVNNFIVTDNFFTGTISVAAGTSDHYRIANNPNCTVTDAGTGTDKVVQTSAGMTFGATATFQTPNIMVFRGATGVGSDIRFGVADVVGATVTVAGTGGGSQIWKTASVASGTITWPAGTTDFSATGGASQFVKQASVGAPFTVVQPVVADVTGAAPLASPALTGTPTAPTAAVDTNTTQLATTAMVLGQAAAATPLVNGTAAVGTSTRFARADHVHPIDTRMGMMFSSVSAVNFNSANTDNAITVALPSGFTRFYVHRVTISHASASLTTSTFGVFTNTGGGGASIVAGGTANTVSTASENTVNNMMFTAGPTASFLPSGFSTPNTVYFRVGTAQGSPATGDVEVAYYPLP